MQCYERILLLQSKQLGEHHPLVADTLIKLGWIMSQHQSNPEGGLDLYKAAYHIYYRAANQHTSNTSPNANATTRSFIPHELMVQMIPLLLEQEEYEYAIQTLTESVAHVETDTTKAWILRELGRAYMELGWLEQANTSLVASAELLDDVTDDEQVFTLLQRVEFLHRNTPELRRYPIYPEETPSEEGEDYEEDDKENPAPNTSSCANEDRSKSSLSDQNNATFFSDDGMADIMDDSIVQAYRNETGSMSLSSKDRFGSSNLMHNTGQGKHGSVITTKPFPSLELPSSPNSQQRQGDEIFMFGNESNNMPSPISKEKGFGDDDDDDIHDLPKVTPEKSTSLPYPTDEASSPSTTTNDSNEEHGQSSDNRDTIDAKTNIHSVSNVGTSKTMIDDTQKSPSENSSKSTEATEQSLDSSSPGGSRVDTADERLSPIQSGLKHPEDDVCISSPKVIRRTIGTEFPSPKSVTNEQDTKIVANVSSSTDSDDDLNILAARTTEGSNETEEASEDSAVSRVSQLMDEGGDDDTADKSSIDDENQLHSLRRPSLESKDMLASEESSSDNLQIWNSGIKNRSCLPKLNGTPKVATQKQPYSPIKSSSTPSPASSRTALLNEKEANIVNRPKAAAPKALRLPSLSTTTPVAVTTKAISPLQSFSGHSPPPLRFVITLLGCWFFDLERYLRNHI